MNVLEDNKYSKWYYSIINKRLKQAPDGYSEKHHIVPRSLGGEDVSDNLVRLTAREHYICHLLLTKMVKRDSPDYYKMWKAFGMMAWCKSEDHERDFLINNRIYEKLKFEFSKAQSIDQSGIGNSGYGKKWYYNEDLKQSKKLDPENVPEDWKRGRVINWDRHFREKGKPNLIGTEAKCLECGKSFILKTNFKRLRCSRSCYNKYSNRKNRNDPNFVCKIERDGEIKTIKRNDFNSYRKIGWKMVLPVGLEPTMS